MSTHCEAKVKVQFFGAFRKLFPNQKAELEISLSAETHDVAGLRILVASQLSKEGALLLSDSVFADDSRILRENDGLASRREFAVLPPVCGG